MGFIMRFTQWLRTESGNPAKKRSPKSAFFIFDYTAMDTFYGRQAFQAICAGLRSTQGTCAFHDGDLSNPETVRELARQAEVVQPAGVDSPLSNLSAPTNLGPYLAGMWTDIAANIPSLHQSLVAKGIAGYVGYVAFSRIETYPEFQRLAFFQLHLPHGVIIKNGHVAKSKYGV